MCGRYQAWVDDEELVTLLEIEKRGSAARYLRQTEVFPGTVQPVLYGSAVKIRAHPSYWGLHLTSREGRSSFLINVRAETAAQKELFRTAFTDFNNDGAADGVHALRRAVVATSGYYEWNGKIKYRIAPERGGVLFLGALEIGTPAEKRDDDPGRRHLILTTASSGEPARIHSRMPLFLRRDELEGWLYDAEFAKRRLHSVWQETMRAAVSE